MIFCSQPFITELSAQNYSGDPKEISRILENIKSFSHYYMNEDYDRLANAYSSDGKILPPNTDMIEGREAIRKRWVLPDGVDIPYHKITPTEIKIIGEYAYDMGYYEGRSKRVNGEIQSFKGKYVIVWKKEDENWKIYLDIWNSVGD